MMIAGALEGFLLGTVQWKAMKEKIPELKGQEWVKYTVLVAVLGWFLGMFPSLFFISPDYPNNPTSDNLDPLTFGMLCIGMGLCIGAIFGLFQWIVLRKHIVKAYYWIVANALGWALGLFWIYLAASIPDENSSLLQIIILGISGGMFAGLSVGIITGMFLRKLIQ